MTNDSKKSDSKATTSSEGPWTQNAGERQNAGKTHNGGKAGGGHPTHAVIARFGGIRPMAHKLGVSVSVVQGWKTRESIPESRHEDIRAAARRHSIDLDPEVLRQSGEAATAPSEAESGQTESVEKGDAKMGGEEVEDADIVASRESAPSGGSATATAATQTASPKTASPKTASGETTAASGGKGSGGTGSGGNGTGGGTSAPTPAQAPAPVPRATGWVPGLLLGAAVLALGAGGAVVLREHWLPLLNLEQAPKVPPEVTRTLDRLDKRMDALANLDPTVNDLSAQVARLEDRVAAVEDRPAPEAPANGADSARVDSLAERQDTLAGRQKTLTERMDALSEQVTGARERLDSVTENLARLDAVAGRVRDMSESKAGMDRVASLGESLTGLDARVSELRDRVGGLAEDLAEPPDLKAAREVARTAAMSAAQRQLAEGLALIQLQEAVRGADGYAGTMAALEKVMAPADLAQEDPAVKEALATLRANAETGAPTRPDLVRQFGALAGQASVAAIGDGESDLLSGVMRRLGNVISVRPTDPDSTGGGVGATLARAETRLNAGDLAGAAETVAALDGQPAAVLRPWLDNARARLANEAALSTLRAWVVENAANKAEN